MKDTLEALLNPVVIILFALALSFFYYRGVKIGHAQAKYLYDDALTAVELSRRNLRDALEYVMEHCPEAQRHVYNFHRFSTARETEERPEPPPSRIVREGESAGRPPSSPSGMG